MAVLAVAIAIGASVLAGCDTTPVLLKGTISAPGGTALPGVPIAVFADEETIVATGTTDGFGEYLIRESSAAR